MAANEIHLGDIGTIFEVTVKDDTAVLNISTATVKNFEFTKPSGTNVVKSASFTVLGVDGKLRYTTVAGDLDEVGVWNLQVYLEMPTGKWHSDIQQFSVWKNL